MSIAKTIVDICRSRNIHFAFAESCTGGKLASAIVDIPGASEVFHGSFVTYSDALKMEVLDVAPYSLGKLSAVCEKVASQMAFGALHRVNGGLSRLHLDKLPLVFTVSTTGYVGPYEDETTPRCAYIGFAGFFLKPREIHSHGVQKITFKTDDRQGNQQAVVERALAETREFLAPWEKTPHGVS